MKHSHITKGVIATLCMLATAVGIVKAASSIIYDNVPGSIPGNVPSVGYEATSTSEWGGQMQFAGTDRHNPMVTVLMSSWACESGNWNTGTCVSSENATFSHPITLNVYQVGADNTVGSLITSKTQTFDMPYRPSTDTTNCTGGRWWDGSTCYSGKAFPISFDLTGTVLPEKAIISVAYNTSHYGAQPIGNSAPCYGTTQGCPYDSLNVGTYPAPSTGTALPTVDDTYLSSTWSGAYCDGTLGTGTFRLDAGCWTGYLPAIRVEANPELKSPTTKDQCKSDGWKTFNNPIFKNQGDCVSYIVSHK